MLISKLHRCTTCRTFLIVPSVIFKQQFLNCQKSHCFSLKSTTHNKTIKILGNQKHCLENETCKKHYFLHNFGNCACILLFLLICMSFPVPLKMIYGCFRQEKIVVSSFNYFVTKIFCYIFIPLDYKTTGGGYSGVQPGPSWVGDLPTRMAKMRKKMRRI